MEEANVDLPWFDFVETNAKDLQDRLLNAGLSVKTVAPIVQIILAETKFTLGVKFGGDKELLEQIVNCVPKHNILLQKAIKSSHSSLLMHILTQTEKVYRDKFTEQWTASTKVANQKDERIRSLTKSNEEKNAQIEWYARMVPKQAQAIKQRDLKIESQQDTIELLKKERKELLETTRALPDPDAVSRPKSANAKDDYPKDNVKCSKKRPLSPTPDVTQSPAKRAQYTAELALTAVILRYPQVNSDFLESWEAEKIPCVFFPYGKCKNAKTGKKCSWSHDEINYVACQLAIERAHPEMALEENHFKGKRASLRPLCRTVLSNKDCRPKEEEQSTHFQKRCHEPTDALKHVEKFFENQLGSYDRGALERILKRMPAP